MTETAIKAAACKALLRAGFIPIRMQAGNAKRNVHGAPAGTPDVLVLGAGGFSVFLEFKRPGEKPTAVQRAAHARLRRLGHTVYVVTSVREALACCGLVWA